MPTVSQSIQAASPLPDLDPTDPLAVLRQALVALHNVHSMRTAEETYVGGVVFDTKSTEYLAPGRTHYHIVPNGAPPRDMVFIGPDYYFKLEGQAWQKMEPRSYQAQPDFWFTQGGTVDDFLGQLSDVTFASQKEQGGEPLLVYSYTVNLSDRSSVTETVHLSSRLGLPSRLKILSYGENQGKPQEQVQTVRFYDFNADITIEPPIVSP